MNPHTMLSRLTDLRNQPHAQRKPDDVDRALAALEQVIRDLDEMQDWNEVGFAPENALYAIARTL